MAAENYTCDGVFVLGKNAGIRCAARAGHGVLDLQHAIAFSCNPIFIRLGLALGLDEYSEDDLVWTRPAADDRYWDDRLVILGHTPTQYYGTKGRAFVTPTWIDIDTGAASGGSPMLLRLEDLAELYA
jgi:hypothetical protein